MKTFTFKRGLHLPVGKYLARHAKINYYLPKGELVFPLFPNAESPCEPLVKKGDRVLLGQKIASSPVHSSVSGTVKNIIPRLTKDGSKVMSIIIESDGLFEKYESLNPGTGYDNLSNEELFKIIHDAGAIGVGGDSLPDKKIDCVIVNCVEDEPYMASKYLCLLEESKRVVEGLKIMLHIFSGAKGYVVMENGRMDAVEAIKKAAANEPSIEIKVLKAKYPQFNDMQLVYAATGRKLPAGAPAVQDGCIVYDVETMVDIERAVLRGKPVMRRIVTVAGGAIEKPCIFNARIGTSLRELIEAAGGLKGEAVKVIAGGPMTGIAVSSLDIPVLKDTSCILCLSAKEAAVPEEQNCIRCGKCVKVCPVNLIPTTLDSLARRYEYGMFEKNHGMDCIDCGSCSYVCPSNRHIAQSISTAKNAILKNMKKHIGNISSTAPEHCSKREEGGTCNV